MRQSTYLNGILTVNAVLLAGLLWTQVAEQPLLAQSAVAQTEGSNIRIPNAASQRKQMIDALLDVRHSVDATRRSIEAGKFEVRVSNLDEISTKTPSRPTRTAPPIRSLQGRIEK